MKVGQQWEYIKARLIVYHIGKGRDNLGVTCLKANMSDSTLLIIYPIIKSFTRQLFHMDLRKKKIEF